MVLCLKSYLVSFPDGSFSGSKGSGLYVGLITTALVLVVHVSVHERRLSSVFLQSKPMRVYVLLETDLYVLQDKTLKAFHDCIS